MYRWLASQETLPCRLVDFVYVLIVRFCIQTLVNKLSILSGHLASLASQNVLKHIGLSVMGVDGRLIKQLKTYILRCHACFRTTSIMDKVWLVCCHPSPPIPASAVATFLSIVAHYNTLNHTRSERCYFRTLLSLSQTNSVT